MNNAGRILNKALLFLLLTWTISFSSVTISRAIGYSYPEVNSTNCFNESVFFCLQASNLNMEKEYYISEPFCIQRDSDDAIRMFFVFCDEKCVGEILFNSHYDSYAFFQAECNSITSLYVNRVKLSLVSPDTNHIYAIRSDNREMICLYGQRDASVRNDIDIGCFSAITLQLLTVPPSVQINGNRSMYDVSCYLDVPIYPNAISPDTSKGLCWAASALAMRVYKYGIISIFYYARELYEDLRDIYYPLENEYPVGTQKWILRAFNYLSYAVFYAQTGMSFSSVKSLIDDDKPIFAGLHDPSDPHGHAVVICGYRIFSIEGMTYYYYYRLMDPNSASSYVTVSVPGTGTSFSYGVYTQWVSYYY